VLCSLADTAKVWDPDVASGVIYGVLAVDFMDKSMGFRCFYITSYLSI
jgi:hypothetical protein